MLFNYTETDYEPTPQIIISSTDNLIGSISLAVCSILLSLSGFIVALSKSRCSIIKCGSLKIERSVPEEDV